MAGLDREPGIGDRFQLGQEVGTSACGHDVEGRALALGAVQRLAEVLALPAERGRATSPRRHLTGLQDRQAEVEIERQVVGAELAGSISTSAWRS